MTDIYTPTGNPVTGSAGLSADMRAEFTAIQAALNAAFANGTWTPTLTFATPGDLAVTYSVRSGFYQRLHTACALGFRITTSAFTHSTASGNLQITGIPYLSNAVNIVTGAVVWGGITKAGYSDIDAQIGTLVQNITLLASGSGVASANVVAADVPSGGTVQIRGSILYLLN